MSQSLFRDLLASGRVANLPSVVSNVLLGCGLGIFTGSSFTHEPVLFLPCLAGCLLYLGGCFLNDWKDQTWDALYRPERAIPAGRISSPVMATLASMCLLLGLGVAVFLNTGALVAALAIVASILVYTFFHKRTAWAVIPMGLCRGLLYLFGFFSQTWRTHFGAFNDLFLSGNPTQYEQDKRENLIWELTDYLQILGSPIVGIVAFVAGLSLFARAEAQPVVPKLNRFLGILLMSWVALTHSLYWMLITPLWNLLSLVPFAIFLAIGIHTMRKSVGRGVSWLLATICLVDFIIAVPLAVELSSRGTVFKFAGQEAFLFPIVSMSAFCLALILQKLAPAT